jgi:hypothetical protein
MDYYDVSLFNLPLHFSHFIHVVSNLVCIRHFRCIYLLSYCVLQYCELFYSIVNCFICSSFNFSDCTSKHICYFFKFLLKYEKVIHFLFFCCFYSIYQRGIYVCFCTYCNLLV